MKKFLLVFATLLFVVSAMCACSVTTNHEAVYTLLTEEQEINLQVGQTVNLPQVTVQVTNYGTNSTLQNAELSWTVDDTDVATLTEDNEIAGVKNGETTLTVTYKNVFVTFNVKVSSTFDVTLDYGFDEEPVTLQVTDNKVILEHLDDKTANGYYFGGWTLDGEDFFAQDEDELFVVSSNLSFTARWLPIVYTIEYQLDSGTNSASNPTSYTVESDTITIANASKNGFFFVGWYSDKDCTAFVQSIDKGTVGNIVLYAKFTQNYCAVFSSGVASMGSVGTIVADQQDKVTLPACGYTYVGYDFVGWTDGANNYNVGDEVTLKNNTTYTARWTAHSYNITYMLDGGINNTLNPSSYTVEDGAITLKEATKQGYVFLGWYEGTGQLSARITAIDVSKARDVTLYARYDKLFTVTFDGNGATGGSTESISATKQSITLPSCGFTKDKHEFVGWKIGNTIYNAGSSYSVNGDVTVTAQWQRCVFDVTYVLDGGINNTSNPSTYSSNGADVTLLDATKEGYIFKGWFTSSTFSMDTKITKIIASSKCDYTVYAKFVDSSILEQGTTLFDLVDSSCGVDIVYKDGDEVSQSVATSLQMYINKVGGPYLNVVSDATYVYSLDKKAISVGNTSLFENLSAVIINGEKHNASEAKDLFEGAQDDRFIIANDRYIVCLVASTNNGLRYAEYQFEEEYLGIRFLTDTATYVPSLSSAPVTAQGNVYVPSFAYRQYLNTPMNYCLTDSAGAVYSDHLRMNGDFSTAHNDGITGLKWITGAQVAYNGNSGITTSHNTVCFVDCDTYSAYRDTMFYNWYEEWYPSATSSQISANKWTNNSGIYYDINYTDGITSDGKVDYSTPAIDTAAEAMVSALTSYLKACKTAGYDHFYLSVGQSDTNVGCNCEKCSQAYKLYNRSGITIRFWNAVINELDKVQELANLDYNLVMFAYQYNLFSPKVYKCSSGRAEVDYNSYTIDPSCIPCDKLWVRIAPLVLERFLSLDDENMPLYQQENGRAYDAYAKNGHIGGNHLYSDWAEVTDHLFSWTYDVDYNNYYNYVGATVNMKDNLDVLKKSGVSYAMIQGLYTDRVNQDQYLNAYVMSKLLWDDDLSSTDARNEFLLYYYGNGDATSTAYLKVKEYYDNFDELYSTAFANGTGKQTYQNINNSSKISKAFLRSQMQLLAQAQVGASSKIAERLQKLNLTPYFMLAKIDSSQRSAFLKEFSRLGGTQLQEGVSASNYTW